MTVGSGASSGCRNSTTSTDSGRGSSEGGGASISHTAGVKTGGHRPGAQYGHHHRSVVIMMSSIVSHVIQGVPKEIRLSCLGLLEEVFGGHPVENKVGANPSSMESG